MLRGLPVKKNWKRNAFYLANEITVKRLPGITTAFFS